MLRVAVDAMGGDFAPAEIVKGALHAVEQTKDLEILLVGREDAIRQSIDKEIDGERVAIIHTDEVIGTDEDPGLAIRRKKKASMVIAMQLVRSGRADAVLSAGSTGALMAGGLLFLGRLTGIKRPALLAEFPTFKGNDVVILDIGANMDAKPEHLLQYAQMGKVYTEVVWGKPNPRIALLNIGSEENKGNLQVKRAYQLFKESRQINFVGNLEAKELFQDKTDVLICDGFVGNVFLKSFEGISRDIFAYFKREAEKDPKVSAVLLSTLQSIYSRMDDSEYGGSMLIGVNGVCIKCHGASNWKAISQGLLQRAYLFAKNNINHKIEEELKWNSKEGLE